MTSLLEKVISVIAPHHCFLCSEENNVLCEACFADVFDEPCEVCALCNAPTADSRVCGRCVGQTVLGRVWMAGIYDGPRRQLIRAYKFDRLHAAHEVLGEAMVRTLPYVPSDLVVVPVPTAQARVRARGYDQAKLLAEYIAKKKGWRMVPALRRRHGARQVGVYRAVRFAQASTAFEPARSVQDRHILLVDDVTTSGATLQAAAEVLKRAGARDVDAIVAAKHVLS